MPPEPSAGPGAHSPGATPPRAAGGSSPRRSIRALPKGAGFGEALGCPRGGVSMWEFNLSSRTPYAAAAAMSSAKQTLGAGRPGSLLASSAQSGSRPLMWSGTYRRLVPGDVGQFTVDWGLPPGGGPGS